MKKNESENKSILLTGATGYIGGRLLKKLEAGPYHLRCMARNPSFLQTRVSGATEVVRGDVFDVDSLKQALKDIDTAFYMVHSMGAASGFEEKDRIAAQNFCIAAHQCGVKRIIYLGGLGDDSGDLSPHLKSRHEVGDILRNSQVPTLELRASIVLGSGSLSFEMIRSLTEKIPVMVMPKWVNVMAQPIGVQDLLSYLEESIHIPLEKSRILEIGGADCLSYAGLMREYANQRGLRRMMIPVPVLTPFLSSLWLGLVTPLYARIGRKLIDSIRHPTVVRDKSAFEYFDIKPMTASEAIAAALRNEDMDFAQTHWFDALSSASDQAAGYGGVKMGGRLLDNREVFVNVAPDKAFAPIETIGGENGWYAWNILWKIRGIIDLLVGGVGMRRGRPERSLQAGDSLDFWRVEAVNAPYSLKLYAEMKLPGKAWLEFNVVPQDKGCVIHQTAIFYPKGLGGLIYWYGIFPVHALIFKQMLKNIAKAAKR